MCILRQVKVENAGTWHYMSTRENNFSNRSHKGELIIVDGFGTTEKIMIGVAIAAGIAVIGGAVTAAVMAKAGIGLPAFLTCLPCYKSCKPDGRGEKPVVPDRPTTLAVAKSTGP